MMAHDTKWSPEPPPRASLTTRQRVLLADAETLFAEGVAALLERDEEYQVIARTDDGGAAVRATARTRPDIVLIDVDIPGLGGITATARIRERSPETRVIALSSQVDQARLAGMLRAGATGYILKRCTFETLLAAVRDVGRGRRFICREAADIMAAKLLGEDPDERGTVAEVLSKREIEVVRLLTDGLSSRGVAQRLGISPRTVDHHRARIMAKLDVSSIAGLTKVAISCGIAPL